MRVCAGGENMKFNLLSAAVALGLLSITQTSIAAETNESIIVTATRTAQTTDETLASVTVITRDEIEKTQSATVADLLKTKSGLDFARNGGIGQTTSLLMRGANSDHLLVLIDGVRASSTTTGSFAWERLPISQIEKIEIVRGPRSTLYGSEAIGGVIQIFTRDNSGISARLETGSNNKRSIQAGFGGGKEIKFNINAEVLDIKGFSALNRGTSYIADDDGFENKSISASVSTPLGNIHSLDFSFLYSDTMSEFDGGNAAINERTESINQILSTNLTSQLTKNWLSKINLGFNRDDSRTYSDFPSKIDTSRKSIDWQNDFTINSNSTIIAGVSYTHEKGRNANPNTNVVSFNRSVKTKSAFINLIHNYANIDFELGARYEDHSVFDNHSTLHGAASFDVTPEIKIYASYGEGYKAPDINELYHPGYFGGWNAGNSSLKPEETETLEIGFKYNPTNNHRFNLSLYDTDAENLIAYQGTMNQAINFSKANMEGIEASWKYQKGPWWTEASATFQDTDDNDGDDLLRRADKKLSFQIGKTIHKKGFLYGEYTYISSRNDVRVIAPFDAKRMGGYGILNLAAQYPLSKEFKIEVKIDNLLDKHYENLDGYNTADRTFYMAINYSR